MVSHEDTQHAAQAGGLPLVVGEALQAALFVPADEICPL